MENISKWKVKRLLQLILISGALIAICAYLIILYKFTALYPPIKKYEFTITTDSLEKKMKEVVKDGRKYNFEIYDRIGSDKGGYDLRAKLNINLGGKKYKYTLKSFAEHNLWEWRRTTTIELIGAFNVTDKFGGYKKDDKRMTNLVELFEQEFIEKLD